MLHVIPKGKGEAVGIAMYYKWYMIACLSFTCSQDVAVIGTFEFNVEVND